MLTIQNQTEEVLVVYNKFFSVNIPIGKTVEIKKEQLKDDYRLFCRYFSDYGEEVMVNYGVKRGGIRRRLHMYYENMSTFPLVTMFLVKDLQTLCLKKELVDLRHIFIFKVVRLKKILGTSNNQNKKEEYLFLTANDKSRFLKLMRTSVFLLPVVAILLLVCVDCLFHKELDFMEKLMLIVFLLGVSILILDDVYHYFVARKWKCLGTQGDD